eukprot:jgi/Botrbrau1/12835/Bobra.0045s0005.2
MERSLKLTLALLWLAAASARPHRHLLQLVNLHTDEPLFGSSLGSDIIRSLGCGPTICEFPDFTGRVRTFFQSAASNFDEVVQNIASFATGSARLPGDDLDGPLNFAPLRNRETLDPQETSNLADSTLEYIGSERDEAVSTAIANSINPGLQPAPLPPPSEGHTMSLADTFVKALAKAQKLSKETPLKLTAAFGKGMHMALAPCAKAFPDDLLPKCCPGIQQPIFVASGLAKAVGYSAFHEDAIRPFPLLQKCF